MLIRTRSTNGPDCVFQGQWDIAFYGDALDARGQAAKAYIGGCCSQSVMCERDRDNSHGLVLDGKSTPTRDIIKLSENAKILLEVTTLDLVELLQLLRAIRHRRISRVDLLYAEPGTYQREPIPLDAPWLREFSLSENYRFEGVAGFASDLNVPSQKTLVAFLGYEGARLAKAAEQLGTMVNWPKVAVFGVPGYAPGWEINSLANNVGTLSALKDFAVQYCAASSVTGALEILEDVHGRRAGQGTTVVAPLGTKPHSIATALFLTKYCEFNQSTLLWDHPNRKHGRTDDVRRWHLYTVDFAAG